MRLILAGLIAAQLAHAATHTYVLAIGNNAPPLGSSMERLHYADDDAADFYLLARRSARSGYLLTLLDDDSQRRFSALVAETRPPNLIELERAVSRLRLAMEADLRAGDEPVLLFFFSGHGSRGNGEAPASLALLDGGLTQKILYEQVLANLPAHYIHLFVDACHAEAVVRPRDADAEIVAVTDEDVRRYAAHSTLDRFPQVGAVVATSETMQAHEWDQYERGVFSHEVISGLRGAADVNGDGLIEYSELAAFLAAANRGVGDSRARLEVVVRPPSLNHRAALFDLRGLPGMAHLVGRPSALGPLWIEDAQGNRLADLNAESSHEVYVDVPADQPLYVHAGGREALVKVAAGHAARFEQLSLVTPHAQARGAVGDALERGLFASSFGPLYYQGWIDHQEQGDAMQPVPLDHSGEHVRQVQETATLERGSRTAGVALLTTGAVLAAGCVVFGGLAAQARSDYNATGYERPSTDASHRYTGFVSGSLVALGVAVIAGGLGAWSLVKSKRPLRLATSGLSWSF